MRIKIDSLSNGAVAEQIDREMQRIADNVLDPNTAATATRTLTIKVTIKPDKDRMAAAVDTSVSASLVGREGVPTRFIFDYDQEGKGVAAELLSKDRNQMMMNDTGALVDGTGAAVDDKKVVNMTPYR
ncbi:MAG: hypothetical protein ACE3L7_04010 [Candidatus Pristimantibacillus sp.]